MNRLTGNSKSAAGFTLVELLVVITIIGILIALLLPAVQAAREAARRAQCCNNLKQMGLALQLYHEAFEVYPFGGYGDFVAYTGWGWSTKILPYMEQENVYSQIDFDHGMNAYGGFHGNDAIIKEFVWTYQCPSAPPLVLVTCCRDIPGIEDVAPIHYAGVATHEAVDYARPPRIGNTMSTDGSGCLYMNSAVRIGDIVTVHGF